MDDPEEPAGSPGICGGAPGRAYASHDGREASGFKEELKELSEGRRKPERPESMRPAKYKQRRFGEAYYHYYYHT